MIREVHVYGPAVPIGQSARGEAQHIGLGALLIVEAKRLAEALAELPGVCVDLPAVETNILYFELDESIGTAQVFADRLRDEGIWMFATGPQRLRAVTHMEVSPADIDRAIEVLRRLLAG